MDDGMDDGTKLHFIPTSFSISWWAESCSVRLSGMVCSRQPRSFQGVDSRGRPDGWTEGRRDGFCSFTICNAWATVVLLGGQKGRNSILQNRTFYFGESP